MSEVKFKMGIVIGSARHDENYAYYNGAVGDQIQGSTDDWKGEVALENFYVHNLGWHILRAKSAAHANALATAMKRACNNKNIGYSMGGSVNTGRYGVVQYGTGTSIKCNADCSSLVRQCVKEATGKDPGDFSTSGEAYALMNTGLFNKSSYASGVTLYTGDILVTKSQGHTVIVVSGTSRGGDEPTPPAPVSELVFAYAVKTRKRGILPEVQNLNDYAGVENDPIIGLALKSNKGSVKYRVHLKGGNWLPYVTGYNWNDEENGYAGDGAKEIDAIEVVLKGVSGQQAQYRVSVIGTTSYYPWQYDNMKNTIMDGYAGTFGKSIDKFQIC